ncbi:MAG: type II toxin-antitoxin system PemK/MazF family toxin [bacterium]
MKEAGQIALLRFPKTDLADGKLRPVLLLARLPNRYGDWLICMISSKVHQFIEELDELIASDANDFRKSGLKSESVVRVTRLAVVSNDILVGPIGQISHKRLSQIRKKLSEWIRTGEVKSKP